MAWAAVIQAVSAVADECHRCEVAVVAVDGVHRRASGDDHHHADAVHGDDHAVRYVGAVAATARIAHVKPNIFPRQDCMKLVFFFFDDDDDE